MERLYSGRRPSVARCSSLQVMDNSWDFFLICAGFWWLNASEMNHFTGRFHLHLILGVRKAKKKVWWRKFCSPVLGHEVLLSGFCRHEKMSVFQFDLRDNNDLDLFLICRTLNLRPEQISRINLVTCPRNLFPPTSVLSHLLQLGPRHSFLLHFLLLPVAFGPSSASFAFWVPC